MLGLWSKPFLQSESKRGEYLIFGDDSDGKSNPNNSYMLVTKDFRSFTVKKIPNNRWFEGAATVNGEVRIIASSDANNPSTELNHNTWYDVETFSLDDANNLHSVGIKQIRDANHYSEMAIRSGVYPSNGRTVVSGMDNAFVLRSSDLVNWETALAYQYGYGSTATIKDGTFYVYSDNNGEGVKKSKDAISWEHIPNTSFGGNGNGHGVYSCDSFLVTTFGKSSNGDYSPCPFYFASPDGANWRKFDFPDQLSAYGVEGKNFILLMGFNYSGVYRVYKMTSFDSIQEVKFRLDGVEGLPNGTSSVTGEPTLCPIDGGTRLIALNNNIIYESNDGVNFTSISALPVSLSQFRGVFDV